MARKKRKGADGRKTFHLSLKMTEPWERMFYLATRHSFGYSKVALVRAMEAFLPLNEENNTPKKMSDALKSFALDYVPHSARPTPAVERGEDSGHPRAREPVALSERIALRRMAKQYPPPPEPSPQPVPNPKGFNRGPSVEVQPDREEGTPETLPEPMPGVFDA